MNQAPTLGKMREDEESITPSRTMARIV